MKKILALVLALCLLLPLLPAGNAYEEGQAFRPDLSYRIQDPKRREYVEMMIDHYIRTDTMVQQALAGGFSAMFLFDGCSDNMNDPALQDLTYYRVTGVCVVVKLNERGKPAVTYFSKNCSTIPDRPLEYGAWSLPEVGKVGPATICDGTYQVYSVKHKGKYEALHLRTDYYDGLIDAVYLTPAGYVNSRASEINVHTRTSNHVSGTSMWSAGCPLVGDGNDWEFWRLVASMYYPLYTEFEVGNFLGTVTVDRQGMKEELYELYQNTEAVESFLTNSRNAQPAQYLNDCTEAQHFKQPEEKHLTIATQLMSLPCSNATDARSLVRATLPEGEPVEITGSIRNSAGNLWYQVEAKGKSGFIYSGHLEEESFSDWLFRKLFT